MSGDDGKGIERAEGEWAQSEVGEGVEEVWERAVGRSRTTKQNGLMKSGIRQDDIFRHWLLPVPMASLPESR